MMPQPTGSLVALVRGKESCKLLLCMKQTSEIVRSLCYEYVCGDSQDLRLLQAGFRV